MNKTEMINEQIKPHKDFYQILSENRTVLMGIAALWIFSFHCSYMYPYINSPYYIFTITFIKGIGFCGVDIFIFLTGMGLVNSISNNTLKAYYWNRTKRIGITFLLISIIYAIVCKWSFSLFLSEITLYIPLAKDLNSFLWFYTLIILIYILFPALYYLYKNSTNTLTLTILLIFLWLIVGFSLRNIMRYDLWGLYNRIPILCIGTFCGFRSKANTFKVSPISITTLTLVLLCGVYLEFLTNFLGYTFIVPISNSHIPSAMLSVSLSFLIAYLSSLLKKCNVGNVIIKLIGFYGVISLEFYSVQEIFLVKTMNFYQNAIPAPLRYMLSLLPITLCAFILYLCRNQLLKLITHVISKRKSS